MAPTKLKIGTRGSRLALVQAEHVAGFLRETNPSLATEIVIIKTEGDRDLASALSKMSTVGVFTKQIEQALLENKIDLAVHSAKDMPSEMTDGLTIAAVPPRAPVADAFISTRVSTFSDLHSGARIGTGSPRRQAQLLYMRPDLQIAEIRGNLQTRLDKLGRGEYDAIVLASAGLTRLGFENHITQLFEIDQFIPAAGQGCLMVQGRAGDNSVLPLCATLDHNSSHICLEVERALLARLGAGCSAAVGALAIVSDSDQLYLRGVVLDKAGKKRLYAEVRKTEPDNYVEAANNVADELIDKGALKLIEP